MAGRCTLRLPAEPTASYASLLRVTAEVSCPLYAIAANLRRQVVAELSAAALMVQRSTAARTSASPLRLRLRLRLRLQLRSLRERVVAAELGLKALGMAHRRGSRACPSLGHLQSVHPTKMRTADEQRGMA